MQICPKCGHENFEDTDFCSACGEYLRWDETEVTPPQPEAEQTSPPPKEPEPWPGEASPQAPQAALPAEPVLVTLRLPDGDETSATLLHVEPGAEARLTALVR